MLAFVVGLGWTVTTWSQQLGDVIVLAVLSAILAACCWYCFSRAPAWSAAETAAPSPIFDYVLYLGSLVWSIELAYVESRFHLLSGQWDFYLLATAGLFFFVAYRFDNRFVLSLALSSLAGWFGLTISRWSSLQDATYRGYALLYCLLVGVGGALLQRRGLKPHFFGTYLNIVANVLFWTVLSGVFDREGYGLWFLALLVACGASLAWGLKRRQFAFVAYAAVYGYVGVSSLFIRHIVDDSRFHGLFRGYRSRHAGRAGPHRAPLREAGMRIYSASSEETLRARTFLKDWTGEGFLTNAQYERLEKETVSELRTTNIFLRLVLFFFTLISVGAAAATVRRGFSFAGIGANHWRFLADLRCGLLRSRRGRRVPARLYRYGIEEALAVCSVGFLCAGMQLTLFSGTLILEPAQHLWFPPPAPSFRSGSGIASGSPMHFSRP